MASAMASAIIGAGSAHADIAVIGSEGDWDAYHYRDELRYAGLVHEDVDNAASLGPRVCRLLSMGYSGDQVMRSLDPDSQLLHHRAGCRDRARCSVSLLPGLRSRLTNF